MIRHLFKLMWNRKRQNFLLIAEIFFSFLVLFGVCSVLITYAKHYLQPMGFNYENVWLMNINPASDTPDAEKQERLAQLIRQLNTLPEIEAVALGSSNAPYTGSTSSMSFSDDENSNKNFEANVFTVYHDAYFDVMGFKLTEGRWFNEQDRGTTHQPVVITQDLKEELFGDAPAVGKVFKEKSYKVVGVIEAFKARGDLAENPGSLFRSYSLADTASHVRGGLVYIRVKPGTPAAYEEKIIKTAAAIATGWTMNLRPMADLRYSYLKSNIIPIAILLVVSLFLILNVALGLFGVLWYNINKRYSEIGLRRAMGATAGQIYKQFLGEVLVLTTFGLILGCFFAVQFPLLGMFNLAANIYMSAILAATLVIYAIVLVCAFQPSRQAAAIQPATALHEE